MRNDEDEDPFFQSQFTHANHLDDRGDVHESSAHRLGLAANAELFKEEYDFEEVEKDFENGWLNVRVGGSDWASVRESARVGFDSTGQGRVFNMPPAGSAKRPPYADPLGPNEATL